MSNLIPRIEFLLQSLFIQQNSCPYCRSKNIHIVVMKYPTVPVKRCQQCLLYFTSPIYKSCISRNFYEGFYSGEGLTTRMPRLQDLVRMKNNNFLDTQKNFNWLLPKLVDAVGSANRSLLEIGCSWGYFLFQAKKYGFDPVGIEIDPRRAAFGREHLGVDIVLDFDELPNAGFNIVFSWHTFEHLTDPYTMLEKIRGQLIANGHLFIVLPVFDWDRFGKRNLSVIGAVHPLGFTVEFFKKNLPRHGFSIH